MASNRASASPSSRCVQFRRLWPANAASKTSSTRRFRKRSTYGGHIGADGSRDLPVGPNRTLLALVVLSCALVPSALAPERSEKAPPEAHDVYEVRFLVLTTDSSEGKDPRLGHVLGAGAPDPAGRFFTVPSDDPETLVANLGKLGRIEVLDRANLVGHKARYGSSRKILVPDTEMRDDSRLVRTRYETIGTKA